MISPFTTPCPLADASSLALVTEKQSAHSKEIKSVGFNNDGTKIVSGSTDKTLKVWEDPENKQSKGRLFFLSYKQQDCNDGAVMMLREQLMKEGDSAWCVAPLSPVKTPHPLLHLKTFPPHTTGSTSTRTTGARAAWSPASPTATPLLRW